MHTCVERRDITGTAMVSREVSVPYPLIPAQLACVVSVDWEMPSGLMSLRRREIARTSLSVLFISLLL